MDTLFNVNFIKAMADPVRQNIVLLLGEKGEMTSGEVAHAFQPLTHATISHHLQILKAGGALVSRKEGKTVWYAIDKPALTEAMDKFASMIRNCCVGTDCCSPTSQKKENESESGK
ncbi:MAG: metalloregulator ArsR/SmtB family transcription factor [Nitrospinota bacterium]|nr:metalloregulator ArsR/SmtB family transcription factor [Nitrospinota bacterium]MDH5678515.1 metalloregulator ArsR/SmtB family transcription factor [Nitrospinota bacterium]MDH5755942.1 metalloregulator ArsR/SmtB family transcription factor [Nitrospinota bacterium]